MPPAFVLSQDQTLMFNPRPIPAQEPIAIRAFTTLHFRCEPPRTQRERRRPAPPPAHPFLLNYNVNQQNQSRREQRHAPCSVGTGSAAPGWARRRVNIGLGPCPVQ